jgi:hypothetical protein
MTYPPPGYGYYEPPGPPPGPPAPPQYGYLVPASPMYGAPDPLVTPPQEGFSGWFSRVFATLGRSWRSLVLISWVTYGVPVAVLIALYRAGSGRLFVKAPLGSAQPFTVDTGQLESLLGILGVGAIVIAFATAVAQGATVWAMTREAAGQPRSLGGALGYGLRNSLRLFGWSLLYGLMIVAGSCACLIPGLYFALAGCLYVPVALYRRRLNPIGTSFTLVNRNFGAALGRMALLVVMLYGVQLVLTIPVQVVSAQASTAVAIVVAVAMQFVTAPLTLVTTVGATLLFAELWNRQEPITVEHLHGAVVQPG